MNINIFLFLFSLTASLSTVAQTINEDSLTTEMMKLDTAGKYEEMAALIESTAPQLLMKHGNEDTLYAIIKNGLAILYSKIGNIKKAEECLISAFEIRKRYAKYNFPEYVNSLLNLGAFFINLGNISKAAIYLTEAFDARKRLSVENREIYATLLSHLGYVNFQLKRYEDAEKFYLDAIDLKRKADDHLTSGLAGSLDKLGVLYMKTGNLFAAEKQFQEALNVIDGNLGKHHPDYADVLNNLAVLYSDMKRYKLSEDMYFKSLKIVESTLGRQNFAYVTMLGNLAILYEKANQFKKEEPILNAQHKILIEYIRTYFPALSDKEKFQLRELNISSIFEYFNSFVFKRHTTNPSLSTHLYNNILATKALLFQSQNKIRNAIFSSGDTSLISLYEQWQGQRNFLSKVFQMTFAQKQQGGIDQAKLEDEVNTLEKQLSSRSEAFAQAADNTLYSWQDVQKTLKSGEAAVEMVRFQWYNKKWTDTIYYAALVITPTSKQPAYILLSNGNDLESKYTTLYDSSTHGKRDIVPVNPATQKADAKLLYQQFWAPVAKHASMQGVKTVYFSGDGVYHRLNLNTLLNPKTKKYLLDELDIRLVTSTRDLLTRRKLSSSVASATLIGYPAYNDTLANEKEVAVNNVYFAANKTEGVQRLLDRNNITELPGTQKEVADIAQLLQQKGVQADTLTGLRATEAALKRLRNPQVLHIATHGFFQKDVENKQHRDGFLGIESKTMVDNPLLRSGLLLAGSKRAFSSQSQRGAGEDGVLTAYEAMNLALDKTDLVVLSACETGLGEVQTGEGVYGLQRAFQTAGAKAVLMSMWKVDDGATQQLMTSFYQHWLAKGSVRAAFKEAQLELRTKYPNPYFWGAFVLTGE